MASRFFVGDIDNFWNNAGNWSSTSGGAGGAGIPGISDDAIIDSNSPACAIDVNIDVSSLNIIASQLSQNGFCISVTGAFDIDGIFIVSDTAVISFGSVSVGVASSIRSEDTATVAGFLLLETGDFFLLEDGGKLLLEC